MIEPKSITLKVGTGTDPAKFAGAVFKYLEEGYRVEARALGTHANYQLCKGVNYVHEFFRKQGREMYVQMSSATESLPEANHAEDDRTIRSFTVAFFMEEDLRR